MNRRQQRKSLLDAVRQGDLHTIEALLDSQPDLVDARNAHGNTPVGEAIGTGRLDVVECLVRRGADPLQANHGGSTLMDAAARADSLPIVRFLMARGCSLQAIHAAQLGDMAALTRMLDTEPDAVGERDRRGGTPLHGAARGNQVPAMRLLLSRGADARATNRHGHSPLADAVEASAVDAARLLLDRGAEPDAAAGHSGGTVLHRAIACRSLAMARLLLDRGADPNRQDAAGKTALHEAAVVGRKDLVALVLAHAPNPTLRTRKTPGQLGGETPLDYARRRRKTAVAALLEEAGRN